LCVLYVLVIVRADEWKGKVVAFDCASTVRGGSCLRECG